MKRHYCKLCGSKRLESKLMLVQYRIINQSFWVCPEHASMLADVVSLRQCDEKPVFVELFSGSGHIAQAAQKRGYQTITIDINPDFEPDICIDIENLRRKQLPKHVHVIHASIPCTVYSVMSLAHHWKKICIGYRQYYYQPMTKDAIKSLRVLTKTIRLIKSMKPLFYFIENPRGALRHIPYMAFIPYRRTVLYSDFGFKYPKPTDIWTNCGFFRPKAATGLVGQTFEMSIKHSLRSNYERSLIPPQLIAEMLDSISFLEPQKQSISY